jgi:ribulose-phosphate 3-epimerase
VKQIKAIHPDVEIGWDGGVNDKNARSLADGGVDVLNAGGFIQKAEDPETAYQQLVKALA